jgi:hypothetical protein
MRGHVRPVANHRRQSINKAHLTLPLQSSKKRIGAIQPYVHHIKPSIGVRFKNLVGAPLFCLLDGQTKGGVVVGTTGFTSLLWIILKHMVSSTSPTFS